MIEDLTRTQFENLPAVAVGQHCDICGHIVPQVMRARAVGDFYREESGLLRAQPKITAYYLCDGCDVINKRRYEKLLEYDQKFTDAIKQQNVAAYVIVRLRQHSISQEEFCRRVPVSREGLYLWARGRVMSRDKRPRFLSAVKNMLGEDLSAELAAELQKQL